MSGHVDVEILRRSLLLHSLPRQELQHLAAVMRRCQYRRDATVIYQEDPGAELHVVVQGHLKVVVPTEAGEEAVLRVVGPGDLFGEMALLDGEPRSATVIALEPVVTYALRRQDFLQLLRTSPAAVENLLAALARTIRRLSEEVIGLMSLDLRGPLVKKLLELAAAHGRIAECGVEIDVELTQEELASMIGATRPRVNTVLGFFEDQGAIVRRDRRIVIREPDLLRRWVSE